VGLEASVVLARHGARVVMAVRDVTPKGKGEAARERIVRESGCVPDCVSLVALDLASRASAASFADRFQQTTGLDRCDTLVLNAGTLGTAARSLTVDGQELITAVNSLNTCVVACAMMPLVHRSGVGRVVFTSSILHLLVKLPSPISAETFADFERRDVAYDQGAAYSASKLGTTLLAFRLHHTLVERKSHVRVVLAHPGIARTNIQGGILLAEIVTALVGQTARMGALPTVLAATDPDAPLAGFAGPRVLDVRGMPRWGARVSRLAKRTDVQDAFWEFVRRAAKLDEVEW